jgi:hypothetical protein
MDTAKKDNGIVVSYLTLRTTIGRLGIALPGLLIVYNAITTSELRPSISAYYYTGMRDIFVGILITLGAFMLTYKGYEDRTFKKRDGTTGRRLLSDRTASGISGVCAVFVALFPTDEATSTMTGAIHLTAACCLFLTFAYMSIKLFTISTATEMTPRKRIRNRVYMTCGWIIVACIATVAVYKATNSHALDDFRLVFWMEAGSLVAFGFSWLTKGEAILGDKEEMTGNVSVKPA